MNTTEKKTKKTEPKPKQLKPQSTPQKKVKPEVKLNTNETTASKDECKKDMPGTLIETGVTENIIFDSESLSDVLTTTPGTSINSANPYLNKTGELKNMSFTDLSSLTSILSQNILKNNYDGGDVEFKKISNELLIKINEEIRERIETWVW